MRTFFLILIILIKVSMLFSETLNPKDTAGLGKLVASMPVVVDMWETLKKEPAWSSDQTGIVERYDTIIVYDVNRDGLMDVIASLIYADLPGAGGFSRVLTLVALRTPDSLKLYFSTGGGDAGMNLAKDIVDTLIPNQTVLIVEKAYSHGFSSDETIFYSIWPKTDLLLSTSTYTYRCYEHEDFRFVAAKKPEARLIARFFERKCDPQEVTLHDKPEKKLQIFRYHDKERSYEEWNPKDEKIWKKAMKAFGPLLEGENLEKLKGE